MAGKTGTSQVIGIAQDAVYDEETVSERNRNHGLFIAFAPVDKPRIVVAVIAKMEVVAVPPHPSPAVSSMPGLPALPMSEYACFRRARAAILRVRGHLQSVCTSTFF